MTPKRRAAINLSWFFKCYVTFSVNGPGCITSTLVDKCHYYTLKSPTLSWLAESDYTIIMSRTLKVTGYHFMYDRSAWFLRVIMSSSRALSCFPLVKKQKHDFHFFFIQCIIKQLLDSVLVISRIMKVEVRVSSRSPRLRLITFTETLIILDITKTSPNNCL